MPPCAWLLFDSAAACLVVTTTDSFGSTRRCPQPGKPAADDQHVGEEVRHVLRVERNEVSRDGGRHGASFFLVGGDCGTDGDGGGCRQNVLEPHPVCGRTKNM